MHEVWHLFVARDQRQAAVTRASIATALSDSIEGEVKSDVYVATFLTASNQPGNISASAFFTRKHSAQEKEGLPPQQSSGVTPGQTISNSFVTALVKAANSEKVHNETIRHHLLLAAILFLLVSDLRQWSKCQVGSRLD